MDILNSFPSKYRKAADYPQPMVETIDKVYTEPVGQDKEMKPVIYFKGGDDKGCVLNKTNATILANLHGRDTAKWKGKEVEVYATKVQFGAEMVDSIRMQAVPEEVDDHADLVKEDVPF